MTHLDEGILRAYLDQELPATRSGPTQAHLARCDACRASLGELRRLEQGVARALAVLDEPAPSQVVWSGISQVLSPPVARDTTPRRGGSSPWGSPLARAAGLVLLATGSALAAVVPGSPLRSLWSPEPSEVAVAPAIERVSTLSGQAGIRTTRPSDRIGVRLVAPLGTDVEVALTGTRAGIFAPAGSTFSAEEGLLSAQVTAGPIRIELPPSATAGWVEVNGNRIVVVDHGRVVTMPPGSTDDPATSLVRFRVR